MLNPVLRGLSFVAKGRAEKKEDKLNNDGAISDLQVTNFFFNMCGKDTHLKIRSLKSTKKLLGTPFKEIRVLIRNYISPKVITAERAKFLSVVQGVGESYDVGESKALENQERKHAIVLLDTKNSDQPRGGVDKNKVYLWFERA